MIRHYARAALYPSLFILLAVFLFMIYDVTVGPGSRYKSEFFTTEGYWSINFQILVMGCALFCVLCTPIFLNHFDFVRLRAPLRLMSWFVLPLAYWTAWAVLMIRVGLREAGEDVVVWTALTLPYIASVIWAYRRFMRSL